MACCGQKRAPLGSSPTPKGMPTTQPARDSAQMVSLSQARPGWTGLSHPPYSSMPLRYLETSPILVRGPASGRLYEFSGGSPVQSVDTRDAQALLRTRFFRAMC